MDSKSLCDVIGHCQRMLRKCQGPVNASRLEWRKSGKELGQLVDCHRLHQMMVKSRLARPPAISLLAPASDRNQARRTAPCLFADSPACLVTIEFRQPDVEQNDMRAEFPGDGYSFFPVVCCPR